MQSATIAVTLRSDPPQLFLEFTLYSDSSQSYFTRPTRLAVHVGPVGIPLRAKSLSDYQWKQFFFLPQLISKGMTKDVKKNNGELEQKVVKESEDKKGDGEMTIDKQVRRIYWIGQETRGF